MTAEIASHKKPNGYIKTSTIVLLAFSSAFVSRIFDTAGAPSTINFLHFATVPFACAFALTQSRTKDRNQIAISWAILGGLLALLGVMLASALWNDAGAINVVLDFLLLGEPFMLLLAIVSVPMSLKSVEKLRAWVVRLCCLHVLLAYVQRYVFNLQRNAGLEDNIQGIFYRSGAGHVVGASVALTFGLYYLVSAKKVPLWLRGCVFFATFWHMLLADAKQVLLSFLVAWMLLLLTKFKDIGTALKYLIAAVLASLVLLWCLQNVPIFRAFNTWIRPEIYGADGEATLLKSASLRIIPSYYESPFNWLLGLGPGHTVGRLGGWMLQEYQSLLIPLGATTHPASSDVWAAVEASWLGDQSSMFSPLFGWAGIWGDLGILGLGAYLYLSYLTWSRLCWDDFSKFLLLNVFAFGLVFSQMEEPGYMLFVAMLIGLRWQEHQHKIKNNSYNESLLIS
jgi:hypothetical protein